MFGKNKNKSAKPKGTKAETVKESIELIPQTQNTEEIQGVSLDDIAVPSAGNGRNGDTSKDATDQEEGKTGTDNHKSTGEIQEVSLDNIAVSSVGNGRNGDTSKDVTDPEKGKTGLDNYKSTEAEKSVALVPKEIPVEKNDVSTKISLPHKKKYSSWQGVGESVVGLAHRRGATPTVCQDAHCIDISGRLIAAVCDGAGSSVLSEVGSEQMSQSIVRLFYAMEPIIAPLLDTQESSKIGNKVAEIIYKYSIRLLQDIAKNNKRETRDFRTTLLLIVTGKENLFWYKVGDGEIVIEHDDGKLSCVGKSIKGEYSNETVFVDQTLKIQDVQYGLLNSTSIIGIALMSDGGAERLVSTDRSKIAPQLSKYFDLLRNSKFPREELYKFLTDYEAWRGTTHDDKTLLVAARKEE